MRAIVVLLTAALWCGSVHAQVPRQINYQGYLTNPGGTPINTPVSMVLKLYDVASDGVALYMEPHTVTVTNGVFNVLIGSVTPLPLPFDVPYYLGITVGTDPEMSPRQLLAANPYSLRAAAAETVNGASGLRLEPNGTSPNHVAGYAGNSVTAGAVGASIGGGGRAGSTCGFASTEPCQSRVTDDYGTIGGGLMNAAGNSSGTTSDAPYATVGGGMANVADGKYSTIGGGAYNFASGSYLEGGATVGGGTFNHTNNGTISGGTFNTASGQFSTISGGAYNDAPGYASAVGGGTNNTAADYSFAAGKLAKANRPGMFVWADTYDVAFDMTQWRGPLNYSDNTFNVRATGVGGVFFATGINGSTGQPTWACYTYNGAGWTCTSDRDVKRNLRTVDGHDALAKVAQLPLYRWQARAGPKSDLDHLGPMAQDFYAAFGLGDSDRSIGLLDVASVALAAIQGLNAKLEAQTVALQKRMDEMDATIDVQAAMLQMRAARIDALEKQAAEIAMLKQQMAQIAQLQQQAMPLAALNAQLGMK